MQNSSIRTAFFVGALLGVLATTTPTRADPQSACDAAVASWTARCPALADTCVRAVLCPPGSVVLDTGCSAEDALRVELAEGGERSFRDIGPAGLSPVGSFADWSGVDARVRHRFDDLAACLASDASIVVDRAGSSGPLSRGERGLARALPWRWLVAMLLALGVTAPRLTTSRARRTAAALVALFAATFVLRAWLAPFAFFHQNGQGAYWIAFALDPHGDRTSYGPGYSELFGWVAYLFPGNPERGVMGAQAMLAATTPVSAFVMAHLLGAPRRLAAFVAVLVAASPALTRIAESESYYATYTSLLFAAGATLLVGASSARHPRRDSVIATLAAGLFVSQAARVTPIGWTAAATLPLVLLAAPGELRGRILRALIAGLGIGLVVLTTSGSSMVGVLRGSLGQQWAPEVGISIRGLTSLAVPLVLVALVVVAASRERRAAALLCVSGVAAAALFETSFLVRASPPAVHHAFAAMWLAPAGALVAALARDLRTPALTRAASAVVLAGFVATFPLQWRAAFVLPTDVLEARFALRFRERLPRRSTVLYVGRAGLTVLTLPLYGGRGSTRVDDPRGWSLRIGEPLPELGESGGPVYYYESSLCDLSESRALCAEARARFAGRVIGSVRLPAQNPYARYEHDSLVVRLVRVR